jgi:hypothetical protein
MDSQQIKEVTGKQLPREPREIAVDSTSCFENQEEIARNLVEDYYSRKKSRRIYDS